MNIIGTHCLAEIAWVSRIQWEKFAVLLTQCLIQFLPIVILCSRAEAQIALPQPPKAAPPPSIPREADPGLIGFKERQKQRKADDLEKVQENQQKKSELQEAADREDLEKPKPLYGFIESSLVFPKIVTTGSRSNYYADPTVHLSVWGRINPSLPHNQVQAWAGFRAAPFGGYGTQGELKGRYAITYLGPGIGFGKIQKKEESDTTLGQIGWTLAVGVSGVSKLSRSDEYATDDSDDFHSSPWSMDPPGAWGEFRGIHVFHGALSSNLILGIQLGDHKRFAYIAAGLAGWM